MFKIIFITSMFDNIYTINKGLGETREKWAN